MTNAEMEAARAKLKAKFESRIGGKGTVRRKQKAKTSGNAMDSGKLQTQIKKLGLNQIPNIAEVNMFEKEGGKVHHFKEPKVQASLQSNTYVISGSKEEKEVTELLPDILHQMGSDKMKVLQDMLSKVKDMGAAAGSAGKDDIPDIGDLSFEDESKK